MCHFAPAIPDIIPSISRVTSEIEGTVRIGANFPHTKHNKEKVEDHILEVQRLLDTLRALSSPADGNASVSERGSLLLPPDLFNPALFASERGKSLATSCRS